MEQQVQLLDQHQEKLNEKDKLRALIVPNKHIANEDDKFIRDKSQTMKPSFFTYYDNASFENTELQETLKSDSTQASLMAQQNRFNKSLFDGVSSQPDDTKPTPFFGAIQRIQPIQHGLFTKNNPFGINFEIPPLPNFEFLQQQSDGQQSGQPREEFTFFSFVKTPDQPKKEENAIQWVSQTKEKLPQQNNYNRRQVKQKFKKQNRKNLLWDLLPNVNESLLDHNLKDECGIQRLWEDEHLDIQMRDLRVSESGLITKYKTKEFRTEYQNATQDVLQIYDKKVFTEYEVVSSALLMLQGVPSQIFLLEQQTFTFQMRSNFSIQNYSLSSEANNDIFDQLMEAGSFFLHLREFTEFMANSHSGGGMILQNFVLAIQDFLIFYQNQINEAWKDVEKRRQFEHEQIFLGKGKEQLGTQMTILELSIHISQLQNQIRLLATICFTQKFIESQKGLSEQEQDQRDKQMIRQMQKRNTYNKQNLLKEFQIDIDRMKNKIWLQDFPKGSALLSYLYRIILCSESDLQAIDLLRRIFQKAINPLLQMINTFVFTGDFEDPFNEFFVEKLYRRGATKESGTEDFIFKLTSQPQIQIPIFLIDTASTIFKAGSSLHLLKKQGQRLSEEGKSVKEYYEICRSEIEHPNQEQSNQRIFKLHQFDCNKLQLVFQINTLKKHQEATYGHFERQLERLQQIEMKIVQEEEENFYKTVFAIQEAKKEFMRKRMAEDEAKRLEKQRKKVAFMKEIQIQLQEQQEKREKDKQMKQAEKDEYKKQFEEYESRKKAIEEELLRQYESALRENQKLGDMRKVEVKAEEQMEKEYHQLIQQYQEEQQMDEIQLIKPNSNEEQKNDDQMMIVDQQTNLKEDEEKLIQSELEQNNPLLSIINETLIKAQENLNISIIPPAQIPSQVQQEQYFLKVDEINLLQDKSEDLESYAEKEKIINDVFIGPLLKNVFDRIDEMKKMEYKRLTWNKKRKQEKIQQVQELRTKWKYQEPQVSIRDKLNKIFDQYDVSTQETSSSIQQNYSTQQQQQQLSYNVPVGLAIRQCAVSVIKEQYKLINKCLIHMMFRKLQLLKHLEALKSIYFCFQGDIISLYMQSIFNDDIESTIKENSLAFVNSQFELSIKMSMSERFESTDSSNNNQQASFGANHLADNFKFELNNKLNGVNNPNFYFTAFNIGDYLRLQYQRKYPIDLIISDQCLEKYNAIFFFLLKLKRINQLLSSLWKYLHSSEFRRLPWVQYNKIRKIQLLRNTMQHFVNMLEQYVLTEVIQAQWAIFKNSLMVRTVFEDLVQLHNDFLDQVMKKCFIDTKDTRIMQKIDKVFAFVLQFNKLVKDYGPQIVNSAKAFEELNGIQDSFEKYTYYLYQLVKHLAHKGFYRELFLLLDFNKFYDKDQEQFQSEPPQ